MIITQKIFCNISLATNNQPSKKKIKKNTNSIELQLKNKST
jgi:hypothetical protein